MDIGLYRDLLSSLATPQIIRLNYSGESTHYPHLIEAIALAKAKGATVELVSAFSSIKPKLIEPLVRSGLDQLGVSIHALEPESYRKIYGFGSSELLLERLGQLRTVQNNTGISTPRLTFALVAMERNLDQILPVMELAAKLGVARLDIHPVIRRDPIDETFHAELDASNRLRQDFINRLSHYVEAAKIAYPSVDVGFSTPEVEAAQEDLGEQPVPCPAPLPNGAKIFSCEQNPWDTVHILANGDVVTCEVRDQQVIGRLTRASMQSIWHGAAYQAFRHQYVNGEIAECNACAYKIAYQPASSPKPAARPNAPGRQTWNAIVRRAKLLVAHLATLTLKSALTGAQTAGALVGGYCPTRQRGVMMNGAGQGISIIIPERDSPLLLERCLRALYRAIARCDADCEIIIVANASAPELYTTITNQFPVLKWHFESAWLGFADAIQRGLSQAQHDWVFLLNTDMELEPDALHELYRHRAGHLFALACQIFMANQNQRREETGYTGLNPQEGLQGLYDGTPYVEKLASTHLYAGGGASLFQKCLLQQLLAPSGTYEPFYWEDFDWGYRAQQLGYQVLFVPSAKAHHQHRATVSRFFSKPEIERMFQGNALLTGLGFGWYQPRLSELSMKLAQHRRCVFRPSRLFWLMKMRFDTGKSSIQPQYCDAEAVCFYPKIPQPGDKRPWLVLVSPYLIYPVAHGGAVRMNGITRALARHYRLVLIGDEGWLFNPQNAEKLDQFEAVHLLRKPRDTMAENRLARMKGHVRSLLCQEVTRALLVYRPAIVQVEYEELGTLVQVKQNERWFITLHDVNRGDCRADAYLDSHLRRYDGIFCCSAEDQALLPFNSHLIENGITLSQFSASTPSQGQTLLFVGPFRYPPNRIGVERFINTVFGELVKQFPQIELNVLCGDEGMEYAHQFPFTHPGVTLLPHSDAVHRHLASATITINPLQNIAGSCLKTIEALAANRVCVSTPDAARGLQHYGFPGLLTASSPEQFITTLSWLLTDQAQRHALEKTPLALLERFDWNQLATRQLEAYEA